MKHCRECETPGICDAQKRCVKIPPAKEEANETSDETTCSRLPYPLRSAEELAGCLIAFGIVDEMAWHDADDYDGGDTEQRIYKMFGSVRDDFNADHSGPHPFMMDFNGDPSPSPANAVAQTTTPAE